tara:strand:- start:86 stop:475 length:390 start_codon:yes stop_codon:yes gene_type:complete
MIDNKPVGFCTGVSASENINQQPVEVLGNIDPVEIEAVGRSITMTADMVRIKGESVRAMGHWPRGGTTAVIEFPAMEATLHDNISDIVIAKIEGLKCQTMNWRIDRGGLMTVNTTFIGTGMKDEVDANT